jgi:outer membrane biosynthesis protein TonB
MSYTTKTKTRKLRGGNASPYPFAGKTSPGVVPQGKIVKGLGGVPFFELNNQPSSNQAQFDAVFNSHQTPGQSGGSCGCTASTGGGFLNKLFGKKKKTSKKKKKAAPKKKKAAPKKKKAAPKKKKAAPKKKKAAPKKKKAAPKKKSKK